MKTFWFKIAYEINNGMPETERMAEDLIQEAILDHTNRKDENEITIERNEEGVIFSATFKWDQARHDYYEFRVNEISNIIKDEVGKRRKFPMVMPTAIIFTQEEEDLNKEPSGNKTFSVFVPIGTNKRIIYEFLNLDQMKKSSDSKRHDDADYERHAHDPYRSLFLVRTIFHTKDVEFVFKSDDAGDIYTALRAHLERYGLRFRYIVHDA